jgi:hypothetical protein
MLSWVLKTAAPDTYERIVYAPTPNRAWMGALLDFTSGAFVGRCSVGFIHPVDVLGRHLFANLLSEVCNIGGIIPVILRGIASLRPLQVGDGIWSGNFRLNLLESNAAP